MVPEEVICQNNGDFFVSLFYRFPHISVRVVTNVLYPAAEHTIRRFHSSHVWVTALNPNWAQKEHYITVEFGISPGEHSKRDSLTIHAHAFRLSSEFTIFVKISKFLNFPLKYRHHNNQDTYIIIYIISRIVCIIDFDCNNNHCQQLEIHTLIIEGQWLM